MELGKIWRKPILRRAMRLKMKELSRGINKPWFENERSIGRPEAALVWDTIRTQDKEARGAEGTHNK